jgi:hypothetical protein
MGCWTPVERLGVASGWTAGEPDADGAFDVAFGGALQGRVRWNLLGHHNRMNALAAIAAARHAGVPAHVAIDALARSATSGGAWKSAASSRASRSTTTSRITRPPSRRPSRACGPRWATPGSSRCWSRDPTR